MAAGVRVCVFLLSGLLVAHTADRLCSFGRIPSTCNTDCVPTCVSDPVCPSGCNIGDTNCDVCVSGCFCDRGLMLFDDVCVSEDVCLNLTIDDIPDGDKCSQYDSCDDCISADPDCQWCPYVPREISVKGSRCRQRDLNPICPVEINDPMPAVTKLNDSDFGQQVQVRPQKLRLELRAAQPTEFTLQFRPAENFPLDVYFLLDITGSFSQAFRETVTPLATELVDALRGISEEYATGFGGFGDKRATPFSLPSSNILTYQVERPPRSGSYTCSNQLIENDTDCNPTISFRHTADISRLDTDELQKVLEDISIHLNVDTLEGGMDGVLQVLTCRKEIGWNNRSLRMLLYMSDAPFHLAGDGKLGAVFEPNPGVCSLKPGSEKGVNFEEYTDDVKYDYPSVFQLRELVRNTETNIVFAVTTDVKEIYQELAEQLEPFARVTTLEQNSSNLVSVIQEAYNAISQEVRLSPLEEYPGLEFQFTAGEGCNGTEPDVCSGVSIGKNISFQVSVNMTTCLQETTTVVLVSTAFGNVELEVVPLCECPCSNDVTMDADVCNGDGDLICGQCNCPTGTSGDKCQCPMSETPPCPIGLDGEECSGRERGECDCGSCTCYIQEELLVKRNFTKQYFGESCKCDHLTSCGGNLTENGELCSGNGECDCETDECKCRMEEKSKLLYGGNKCECNPIICYSEEHKGVCVYTGTLAELPNAACDSCNGCQCRFGTERGNGTCIPLPNLCLLNEECARCQKGLQSNSTDCEKLVSQGCNASLYTVETEPAGEACTFVDAEDCTHTFYVQPAIILVDDDKECSDRSDESDRSDRSGDRSDDKNFLFWLIPVAVIVGLLILGGLILALVLLIVCIKDRMEYQHFKKDLEDANWDQQENPMYVSPSQQYPNVAYKARKGQTATE